MGLDRLKIQGSSSDFEPLEITALKAIAFRRTPWSGGAA